MYDSPITLMVDQMRMEVEKRQEAEVIKAVQNCGVYVDKCELIKALAYDRDQYSKGYHDRDDEIVRCKDCKWSKDAGWVCQYYKEKKMLECRCPNIEEVASPGEHSQMVYMPTDFCSYGERKDE